MSAHSVNLVYISRPFGKRSVSHRNIGLPICHSLGMLHGSFRVFHYLAVTSLEVLGWTCWVLMCASSGERHGSSRMGQKEDDHLTIRDH